MLIDYNRKFVIEIVTTLSGSLQKVHTFISPCLKVFGLILEVIIMTSLV